jgi:hypothetical protein
VRPLGFRRGRRHRVGPDGPLQAQNYHEKYGRENAHKTAGNTCSPTDHCELRNTFRALEGVSRRPLVYLRFSFLRICTSILAC